MPVIVHYSPVENGIAGEARTAIGYVNYGQDKVHFPDHAFDEATERAILASLDTKFVMPTIPADLMAEVEEIRRSDHSQWGQF